jgi:hypothetical protein
MVAVHLFAYGHRGLGFGFKVIRTEAEGASILETEDVLGTTRSRQRGHCVGLLRTLCVPDWRSPRDTAMQRKSLFFEQSLCDVRHSVFCSLARAIPIAGLESRRKIRSSLRMWYEEGRVLARKVSRGWTGDQMDASVSSVMLRAV